MRDTGPRANRVNLVFVSEGYTSAEEALFAQHVATRLPGLLADEAWRRFADHVNIFRLFVPSRESGLDIPDEGVYRDTAFDAYITNTGSWGYSQSKFENALLSSVPEYDVAILFVNSSHSGPAMGGGGKIFMLIPTGAGVDNNVLDQILLHELGHAFAGLADEYWAIEPYTGPPSVISYPNASSETDRELVPWARFIFPETPVPTISAPDENLVGVFQGAALRSTFTRPTYNSKMRTTGRPWGPVNLRAFATAIHRLNLDGATAPPTITQQPSGATVPRGASVTLSVQAAGVGPLTYLWVHNGVYIAGIEPSYTIAAVDDSTAGTYTAEVTNAVGGLVSVTVRVAISGEIPPNPDFATQNVGVISPAGSASYDSGTRIWSVSGGGADIWNNADAFTYESQAWTGDGELVTHVQSIDFTNGWAKAGLMFRESPAAGSRNVFLAVTADNGIELQARTTAGSTTNFVARVELRAPIWLKLTRQGSLFRGYYSADGVSWNDFGALALDLPNSIYAGLAVTSHAAGTLCIARFSDVYLGAIRGGVSMPPNAPSALQASAASTTEVQLSWSDNSADETGFYVERAAAGGSFVRIASTVANTTQWQDSGLTAGATYSYRVLAYSSGGESAFSPVAIITLPTSPPPGGPSFATQNVGVVSPAGSASYDSGTRIWSVSGGGADIWNNADAFTYESQAWTGDGELVTHVQSIDFTNGWAKAGVMFRESPAAGSRNVFLAVTADNGIELQARTTAGSTTNFVVRVELRAPIWLKLTRQSSLFHGYYSTDGVSWNDFGALTLDLPSSIYAGLAVTSHAAGTLCIARFSDVYLGAIRGGVSMPPNAPSGLQASAVSTTEVQLSWSDNSADETGFYVERAAAGGSFVRIASTVANTTQWRDSGLTAGATYSYRVLAYSSGGESAFSPVATLTLPTSPPPGGPSFATQNVGAVSPAGSASYDSGTRIWSVSGGGADIWNNADAFTYESQAWTGDGELVTHVQSIDFTNGWAKAGVMFRESPAAGSRNVFLAVTADNGVELQARTTTGSTTNFVARVELRAPIWLKLTRQGSTFLGYYSADGVSWNDFGTLTLDLPSSIYAGLAVTSHAAGTLCTARFSDVYLGAIRGGVSMPPNAPNGLQASAASTTEVQLSWSDNSADETGFYVERAAAGGSFVRIASTVANTTQWRDSGLTAGATYSYRVLAYSSGGDSAFSPVATITLPTSPPPVTLSAPNNLVATAVSASQIDLRWTDNTTSETGFQLERSSDGANYTLLRTLAANVITASDTTVAGSTAYYYRVRAVRDSEVSSYSNVATATTPNRPWFQGDVGSVGIAGSQATSGNTITVRGSGADIWDSADAFYFLYQVVAGDCLVEAQVSGISPTHAWAKAGVMIRESNAPDARNVFVYLTPNNETHAQARASAGAATGFIGSQYGTPPPYWVRLVRAGNTITAYSSADGRGWLELASYPLAIGAEALVGFAVTSHDPSMLNTATFTDPFIR